MKCISQYKVLEYRYDSEKEAEWHEKQMKRDGWSVKSFNNVFGSKEKWRRYEKRIPEGVFL